MARTFWIFWLPALAVIVPAQRPPERHADPLRIVVDQAEEALRILEKRARGETPTQADWDRHAQTEGYQRLKQRQESFGATEFDAKLRAFLAGSPDPVARRKDLRSTLESWRSLDLEGSGQKARAYLPGDARLTARIYVVVKQTTNSFVFDLDGDPAIFLYLNPDVAAPKFANTLTHELHHVGGTLNCDQPEGYDELPENTRHAVDWLSGFGEGLAMLAAAGGPHEDPHAASPPEERAVWERDLAGFESNIEMMERFFRAVLRGDLSAAERREQGMAFINTDEVPQGAFYTVGWRMAAAVEEAEGRAPVIRAVCDPRVLIDGYNRAAPAGSKLWSQGLIDALYGRILLN